MGFTPDEILFCPTTRCILSCAHCDIVRHRRTLSVAAASKFITRCKKAGITRVSFTGGEPFLKPRILSALIRTARRHNMLFGHIATNAVWQQNATAARRVLSAVHDAGYDGTFWVSVDAFHRQSLGKVATFIMVAAEIWQKSDIVSIVATTGVRDRQTHERLCALARHLGGRLIRRDHDHAFISSPGLFVRIFQNRLSPVGAASRLVNPWDGKWFVEDRCAGPGNAFLVLPDGTVKPCCGYASDRPELTIGNIGTATPQQLMRAARTTNRFVATVFTSGLSAIRRRLSAAGVLFPAKTSHHCFFCNYILTQVPRRILMRCLD